MNDNNNKKIKSILLIITIIILAALAFFVIRAGDKEEMEKKFTFECNSERVEFLNTLGHIVEPDPESEKLTIPAEFNETYEKYNDLQKSQGFDLMPYAGKEVIHYTYTVLNYPDYPENVHINLLFDDHLMIGADISYDDAENGFVKPLIAESAE